MSGRVAVGVRFTPAEVGAGDVDGAVAVVIDIVRATSCIAEALAAGAASVHPAVSVEAALQLRTELDARREGQSAPRALLCGERRGLRIDGFDLGNSPAEFTRAAVGGRPLVMTTTNGTRALMSVDGARRVLSAAFVNLRAVAAAVRRERRVLIVCAGKEGRFALDDVVCAGHVARRIVEGAGGRGVALDEPARAAFELAGLHGASAEMLAATAAGKALVDVGLGADLELCARVDRHAVVPELIGGRLTAAAA